ncbi:MAG TPA: YihY/virulence factor BrkB family protein, partial [Casimicrobiaceae bacterium]|nr:YihY/virulence factor BrkB family protein [Casimicrobiaceae bacterium]
YALLSIVPLMILIVIALTHVLGESQVLDAIARYLEWVVPGQGGALAGELARFMQHRDVMGWVLLGTMVFFSSLAFTVLENAMSVIFYHRVAIRRRHFMMSALLPYFYILLLGAGLLVVTVIASALQQMASESIEVLHRDLSLQKLSRVLLYLIGVSGEILVLSSIYLVMPVGRLSWRHALVGGASAAVLWEISRHALVWYFATLSQVQTLYGSLTTAIVVLLSLEIAAIVLLFGAQVIAEYERVGQEPVDAPAKALRTDEA